MFACTSMNGVAQAIAVTDVCKTPTPGGPAKQRIVDGFLPVIFFTARYLSIP